MPSRSRSSAFPLSKLRNGYLVCFKSTSDILVKLKRWKETWGVGELHAMRGCMASACAQVDRRIASPAESKADDIEASDTGDSSGEASRDVSGLTVVVMLVPTPACSTRPSQSGTRNCSWTKPAGDDGRETGATHLHIPSCLTAGFCTTYRHARARGCVEDYKHKGWGKT